MKIHVFFGLLVVAALILGTLPVQAQETVVAAPPSHGVVLRVQSDWGKMPLYFIANQGQMDDQVSFYVQGKDKTLYFTPQGLTFALNGLPCQPPSLQGKGRRNSLPRFGVGLGKKSER